MTSNKHVFLFVIFCGISLHAAIGQMDVFDIFSNTNNDSGVNGVQAQEDDGTIDIVAEDPISEEDDDAMTRLESVNTLEDFVTLLQRNGQQLNISDIADSVPDEDGKQTISGGGRLAVPDQCSPRNTTIRISMEDTDSDTAFFPRCTKMERCGGCCPSPNLKCVPRYTERVSLRVLKGRVPFPGATHLEYTGFATVIVDRHVTCRLSCLLNAESCGPKKQFYQRKCMCKCKTYTPCAVPTVWDPEECACKCPQQTNCCPNGDNCGMVLNPSNCECELNNDDDGRMNIAAGGISRTNHTQQQTHGDQPNPQPTPSTTTIATTTTAPTTTQELCSNHHCPPRFIAVFVNNSCQCRPSFSSRRGRPRGRGRSQNRNRG